MKISPFSIHIPEAEVDDLRRRLSQTRWPDEVEGAGWAYGANLAYLQEIAAYWQTDFDWRRQENWLNSYPQFQAEVQGLGIHFVHLQGKGPQPLPLVLTHGWPSTFFEMLKLASLLADPEGHGADPADAFDVVVPSVPGFGFSDRPKQAGMTRSKVATMWVELMDRLGYPRFGAHANDIGAVIGSYIARDQPDRLVGFHTMMPAYPPPAFGPGEPPMSPAEHQFDALTAQWDREEGGYNLIQETRPQTLGYGLNDSPAGLAAWILEKWRSWGALGGDLEKCFTRDDLLTNLSIYWFTQTANSAGRSYYERAHDPNSFQKGARIGVPTGAALSMEMGQRAPREWAERVYTDIRRWTEFDHGGHFLVLEDPELLASDLREFFRPLRSG